MASRALALCAAVCFDQRARRLLVPLLEDGVAGARGLGLGVSDGGAVRCERGLGLRVGGALERAHVLVRERLGEQAHLRDLVAVRRVGGARAAAAAQSATSS